MDNLGITRATDNLSLLTVPRGQVKTTALSTKCSALGPPLPPLTALLSPHGSSIHQWNCKQVPPQPKGQTCGSYKAETGPSLSASLEQVDQLSRNDSNPKPSHHKVLSTVPLPSSLTTPIKLPWLLPISTPGLQSFH